MDIQIDQIKVAHYQVWPEMAAETFAQLVADIKMNGVAYPILVDENLVVLDGHHRLKAAKLAGLTHIDCYVCEGVTEEDKLQIAHKMNATTRTISTADKKRRAVQLRAERRSYRQIAEWLGVGKSTVERWLRGVPSGTFNRVKGSDGKEYPSKQPARPSQQDYVNGLREEVSNLESEVYRLKDEIRTLSVDNRTKDAEISRLTIELSQAKMINSLFGGSDNGKQIFATIVGLNETASIQEIDRAFRKAKATVHPDAGGNDWVSQRYNVSHDLFKRLYIGKQRSTG
ncbi:helix-turn-helix domain-containing protein [Cytobacillus praedii]|uniref:helix-turn-helix domain-containing protein n=1 Tax=Cytobacillus praedii TaxID=1742358 RepID=UPI00070A4FFD|nr:ParB N-terminal domain-containing protein [Cytobacillus praedii]